MGTTVRLYLPRAGEVRKSDESITPEMEMPLGHGEHLLVIEDDEYVRSLVTTIIETLGYRVTSVAAAADARDVLATGVEIDLVVSDVVLPGGTSGPEFAQEARQKIPGLKFIFMSGYPPVAAGHHEFPMSDEILLDKPFTREKLANSIRNVLDEAGPVST